MLRNEWNITISVNDILTAVIDLLTHPHVENPLNSDAAALLSKNETEFAAKV